MNEPPPQPNGNGANQIVITLDISGNLTLSAPQNKIIALGMLSAAQHIIIGMQSPSPILPARRIIP